MKLSPAAHKWVRGLVDYGGLVVFLLGFFYNTKVAGLASREALVEATWWLVGGSALALVVGLIFERRIAPFPLISGGAALLFGGAGAIGPAMQSIGVSWGYHLFNTVPYVLTLVILVLTCRPGSVAAGTPGELSSVR